MKNKLNRNSDTPAARPKRRATGETGERSGPPTPYPTARNPSAERRQAAKARIMNAVNGWLEVRIAEVFEMADEDEKSEIGPDITWRDLTELRWQICGCIATDLEHDLGEQVEEILVEQLRTAPLHPQSQE